MHDEREECHECGKRAAIRATALVTRWVKKKKKKTKKETKTDGPETNPKGELRKRKFLVCFHFLYSLHYFWNVMFIRFMFILSCCWYLVLENTPERALDTKPLRARSHRVRYAMEWEKGNYGIFSAHADPMQLRKTKFTHIEKNTNHCSRVDWR